MRRHTIAHKLIFLAFFLFFCPTWAMAESDEDSQPSRIKIDEVDVSKAPRISIHATFLDKTSHPINPSSILQMDVLEGLGDTQDIVTSTPEIKIFKHSDIPLDLALIMPLSQRFTEDDIKTFSKSMENVIVQARDNDRMAGIFDDGRTINIIHLGEPKVVAEKMGEIKPQGQPSFLYSSLDKALDELTEPANLRKAHRAIILVTDAFDTYTYDNEGVRHEIIEKYKRAKEYDIHIYVVMYNNLIPKLIPMFEALSRKTGGTYRDIGDNSGNITTGIKDAWGEILGELFIEFEHPGLTVGQEVVYSLNVTAAQGDRATSRPYAEIKIETLRFNWKKFFIITGIIVGILLVCLVVFLVARKIRQKRELEEEALREQEIQEKIERGEVCPICRRTMKPEWKECMFCARDKAEELKQAKEEQAKKKKEEAQKNNQKKEGRVCQKCGRTMLPQWKECMFCKSGIGSDNDGAKKAPTGAEKKDNGKAAGSRICPVCHREMKPHWTICLYCEADGNAAGQNNQAQKQGQKMSNMPGMPGAFNKQAQNQNAAAGPRICPTCGQPMKAHWDVCLYCEANRMRN